MWEKWVRWVEELKYLLGDDCGEKSHERRVESEKRHRWGMGDTWGKANA